jgi:ketosteroid isomerase-like protein
MTQDATANTVIEMERQALSRWAQGDPDGFLDISSSDVTYFDPFVERRLDGLDALRALYEQLRGKVRIDHFEIIAPRVQVVGEAAILTFQFDGSGSEGTLRWNTTEVYRQTAAGWKIVHTHWALRQASPEPKTQFPEA